MIEIAGDVDVGAADVEGRQLHVPFVDVLDLRRFLVGEVAENCGADVELRRVIGRRVAGRRGHLGERAAGNQKERDQQKLFLHFPDGKNAVVKSVRRRCKFGVKARESFGWPAISCRIYVPALPSRFTIIDTAPEP